MELLYVYGLVFSFLIFIGGIMMIKDKGHFIYIRLYSPERDRISNKVLVIGLLRCLFKFKFFWYINLKVK